MKKFSHLLVFGIALFISAQSFAQTPQKFNYQAVCRDSLGSLIINQAVTLRLTIHDLAPGGTSLYKETHSVTTNNFGLVAIAVGGGTIDTGTFSSIPWGTGDKYLEVEINTGSGFHPVGTTQLLSVPYALYAKNSETTNQTQNLSSVLTQGNDANNLAVKNVSQIAIGTPTLNASAALEINSTKKALILPRMTTVERDSMTGTEGMIIYNTDLGKFQGYVVDPLVIDQQNTLTNSSLGAAGQSFTAGMTGAWNRVEVSSTSIQSGTISVYQGNGTAGTLLQTQSISVPSGVTQIVFNTPVPIVSGQVYTFSTNITLLYNNTDVYGGGSAYLGGVQFSGDLYFKIILGGGGWINLN